MYEHESDILVAEPEEEVVESKQNQSSFASTDLLEAVKPSYEQEQKQNIKKQADAFINYNSNHLNKVYKKYDIVETYVPKKEKKQEKQPSELETFAHEQSSYVPERETLLVEKVESKPEYKLKTKAKVWLVCFSMIAIMLFSLCIYNGINIGNLNNSIDSTTTSINNINKDIQTIVKDIGKLTDDQEIMNNASDLGLTEVDDAHNIEIELNEKNDVKDYKGQTNFFDRICNFFNNLFGG